LNQIIIRQLSFTTEYVNAPKMPFRALVNYKNISDVYFRIIEIEPENDRGLINKLRGKSLIEKYKGFTPVKEWAVKLENDGDFQQHAVELKMSELPFGYYVVLAGTDKDFTYKKDYVAY